MEVFSISFLKLKLLIPGHEGHSSLGTLDLCSCQKLRVVEEMLSILFVVFMAFATASGVFFLPVFSPMPELLFQELLLVFCEEG